MIQPTRSRYVGLEAEEQRLREELRRYTAIEVS
jgi:hypothetical protein